MFSSSYVGSAFKTFKKIFGSCVFGVVTLKRSLISKMGTKVGEHGSVVELLLPMCKARVQLEDRHGRDGRRDSEGTSWTDILQATRIENSFLGEFLRLGGKQDLI